MEKEENIKNDNEISKKDNDIKTEIKSESSSSDDKKELSPEERILELEDKIARTFAEMENKRRRFEKEKDDACDHGGFAFAQEALH